MLKNIDLKAKQLQYDINFVSQHARARVSLTKRRLKFLSSSAKTDIY